MEEPKGLEAEEEGGGHAGEETPEEEEAKKAEAEEEAGRRSAEEEEGGEEAAAGGGGATADAAAGKEVFSEECSVCHGATGHGGNGGPDLRTMPLAKTQAGAEIRSPTEAAGCRPSKVCSAKKKSATSPPTSRKTSSAVSREEKNKARRPAQAGLRAHEQVWARPGGGARAAACRPSAGRCRSGRRRCASGRGPSRARRSTRPSAVPSPRRWRAAPRHRRGGDLRSRPARAAGAGRRGRRRGRRPRPRASDPRTGRLRRRRESRAPTTRRQTGATRTPLRFGSAARRSP